MEFLFIYLSTRQPSTWQGYKDAFRTQLKIKNIARVRQGYQYVLKDYQEFFQPEAAFSAKAGENYTIAYVSTPKGSQVQTYYDRTPDFTTAEINAIRNQVGRSYPRAEEMRTPSIKYNCHSYAWYSTAANNKHWIDYTNLSSNANVSKYWTDGSYKQVSSASIGAKIYYVYGDHSAIHQGGNRAVSKWGAWGVYEHLINECPYNSSTLRYYVKS